MERHVPTARLASASNVAQATPLSAATSLCGCPALWALTCPNQGVQQCCTVMQGSLEFAASVGQVVPSRGNIFMMVHGEIPPGRQLVVYSLNNHGLLQMGNNRQT